MWWSRPTDPASRVSRYWNARGDGQEAAAHQVDLDPSLLETIELLDTVDDAHDPDPDVLDRMERTLMTTIALSPSRYDTVAIPEAGRNGRVIPLAPLTAPMPLPRSGERRYGLFGAVATAAIVVLVVVASLVIVHPNRRAPLAPAPAVLPAVSGTPATDDAVTTETLIDTTIAAMPVDRTILELDFWRISPEARPLPIPALGGTQIVLVESGEVAVDTAEPLAAGEQVMVTGGETAFLTAPVGDASFFTMHLAAGSLEPAKEVQLGSPGTSLDTLIYLAADGLPGGSGRLVLERITVPPGGTMPPEETVRWSWTEVGSGELGLTLEGEHLPFRWKSGTERTFRFSQRLPLLQPGTRMTFRNAGDDPLVLYRLTLAPTDGKATPAT